MCLDIRVFIGGIVMFWLIIVFLLLFGGFFLVTYNALIAKIEAVNNNNRQIDIQLDRRYKVFESLVNVVKKYMDYEKSTLKEVVALRQNAQDAKEKGDFKARYQAEDQISQTLGGLNVVFEQYPDLKANQNALQLQEEIVSTENRLAFAKQAYNDSIEQYNVAKKSLLQSLVVAMVRDRLDKNFTYWKLSDETITKKENYKVNL